jgi:4-amino-4-deoxy-L-arabinose transferase-like glycosyltransferase
MKWKDIRQWSSGRWFTLILTLYFLLGLYYIWQVPPFEGPDEGEHFAYIEWLVAGHGFPPQGNAAWETPVRQEAGQPPLYYLLAAVPATITGITDPAAVYHPNPYAFTGSFTPDLRDNHNRTFPYPDGRPPLRGGWLAFYLARGLTLLFGLLLLWSLYGLTRTLWPEQPGLAPLAVALVAFTPQVVFLSSVVSNDIPAAALSTLCLWLLVQMVRQGITRGRAIAAGVTLGLAGLTKVSGLLVGVPVGLGLIWLWWLGRYRLTTVLRAGIWLGGSFLLTAGWWFGRVWLRYGTPLGLESHDFTPWAIHDPADVADRLPRWLEVFRSYWIALGWGTIRPAGWVYTLLGLLTLLGVAGLGILLYRAWKQQPAGRFLNQNGLWLILAAFLLLVAIFLEVWMHRVVAAYGRLLFPAIAVTTLLLIKGWRSLHPYLPLLPILVVALITLLSPPLLFTPVYSPPTLLTPAEVEATASQRWQFSDDAGNPLLELLSSEIHANHVENWQALPVTLCWRALAPMDKDYAVLLHIIGPEERIVIQRRTYTGNGRFPTSYWSPGDAFCDRVYLRIVDVEDTFVYNIELGMIDETTLNRLHITTRAGNPLALALLGPVRIDAADTLDDPLLPEAGPVQLVEYHLPQRVWQPDHHYTIDLTWGIPDSIAADYQLFVHLRQPQFVEPVAQADGPPLDGWYPTSWWRPNTLIEETRSFPLPAAMPPGTYHLVLGFYSLVDGHRLGPDFDLGEIQVVP